ncbi:orp1 like protein [Ophiostoma piceae UAMH 11346]|uniref:Orp1 like protein n=1 Tax=Ophiostoma piceae (strain UAMH 11346) TaxID=1262450 RepID=S3BYN9_OPHP1|nr:orp1 like protein [Ophiostoma piceae UAMH 11346]
MELKSLLNDSPIRRQLASISEQRSSSASSDTANTPSTLQEPTPPLRSSEIPPLRQPTRSRTPWDGNGYSLSRAQDRAGTPLEMPAAMADIPESQSAPHQSQAKAPCSQCQGQPQCPSCTASSPPRHRLSDSQESRGSFSSAYTGPSPIHSNAHSRISSLTTVPEASSLLHTPSESGNCEPAVLEPSRPYQLHSPLHQRHQSHQGYQSHPNHLSQDSLEDTRDKVRRDIENLENAQYRTLHRLHRLPLRSRPSDNQAMQPASPQQPRGPTTADQFSEDQLEHPQDPPTVGGNLHPETPWYASLHSSAPQMHRRVVSAPHFTPEPMPSFNTHSPEFGPAPEPTPPRSSSSNRAMNPFHLGLADASQPPLSSHLPNATSHPSPSQELTLESPGSHQRHPSVSSTGSVEVPDHLVITLNDHNRCFFMTNCETASQLRKAISHVFGRNKLCTRRILKHVWVYYCRKHYQRTRYRNGVEYPQRQIALVRMQIQRVQKWSDENKAQGHGSILLNWLVSIRKREKERLERLAGKKRAFDENDEDDDDDSDSDGGSDVATHVPPWLLALVGKTFDSPGMLSLVNDIHNEINAGRLAQIPDIEILPNILEDKSKDKSKDKSNEGGNKKTHKRRSTSTVNNHRRTQSVNTSTMRPVPMLGAPSGSQPNNASNMAPHHMLPATYSYQPQHQYQNYQQYQRQHEPAEKRQRTDSNSSGYTQDSHGSGERYNAHPTSRYDFHDHSLHGAPGPHVSHVSHERHRSMSSLQAPAPTGHGPLPAPNSQRLGGPSSIQRLELPPMPNYDSHAQRPHQRSYSEAGSLQQLPRHGPSASLAHPGYVEQEPRDTYQPHQGRPTSSGYGASNGNDDAYEHYQLPPLHTFASVQQSPSALDRNPPSVGVSRPTHHMRQQSSPTSTRLPATMEATGEPETPYPQWLQ